MNSRCEVMDACYFITLSATFSSTWLHSLTITFWSPSPDHLNELPSTPVECSDDKYFSYFIGNFARWPRAFGYSSSMHVSCMTSSLVSENSYEKLRLALKCGLSQCGISDAFACAIATLTL